MFGPPPELVHATLTVTVFEAQRRGLEFEDWLEEYKHLIEMAEEMGIEVIGPDDPRSIERYGPQEEAAPERTPAEQAEIERLNALFDLEG